MTFEEILARDGRLVYRTRGVSMKPMLYPNRDLVCVTLPEEHLKKYDVALYKRGENYVLHRVVGVRKGDYLIRGDNTYTLEYVRNDAVIGVLETFVRDGKKHSVTDFGYCLYVRLWNAAYPVRVLAKKLLVTLRKITGTGAADSTDDPDSDSPVL